MAKDQHRSKHIYPTSAHCVAKGILFSKRIHAFTAWIGIWSLGRVGRKRVRHAFSLLRTDLKLGSVHVHMPVMHYHSNIGIFPTPKRCMLPFSTWTSHQHACTHARTHEHTGMPEEDKFELTNRPLHRFNNREQRLQCPKEKREHKCFTLQQQGNGTAWTRTSVPLLWLKTKTALQFLLTRIALGGEGSAMQRKAAVLPARPPPPTSPPLPRSKGGLWAHREREGREAHKRLLGGGGWTDTEAGRTGRGRERKKEMYRVNEQG